MQTFSYNIKDWNNVLVPMQFQLSDDLYKYYQDANNKYELSKKYIFDYWYHIWNKNFKDYYLFSWDRAAHIKSWQSNVVYWLVRSTIDNYISFASEKPLGYKVTATNPIWFKNIKNVQNVLSCTADKTLFNREIQSELIEALITWNYCFKTVYVKNKQTEKAISLVDDILEEYEFDTWVNNTPKTVWVDIFKVFPDVYPWELRYITERDVVSHEKFVTNFKTLIDSKKNKLKWKIDLEKILKFLSINENWNNTEDFWRVRTEVFRNINNELASEDTLPSLKTETNTKSWAVTLDQDSELTKWLIEYKCYTDTSKIVLIANNYPLYIWENPFRKINYHYGNAYHTKSRFSEWIAYLLRELEKLGTSFLNTLVDWVRAVNTPNFIAPSDLFIDPKQVEKWDPWDIWYTDWDRSWEFRRVEKWWISDFGMLWTIDNRWQVVSWVSDYNAWVSSKERVATAVASLVESTNRRILTFLKKFSHTISDIWYFQLFLCRKNWTKPQWWYTMEEWEQMEWETPISWRDLAGWFNISLETEWLLSVNKETEINKLLSMYDKFAWSWIINSSNLVSDVFRFGWLDPNKYVVNQDVTIPSDKINKTLTENTPMETTPTELPTELPAEADTLPTLEAQQMQQAINPQAWA